MGQFIAYRTALDKQDPDRALYLAVPDNLYDKFFATPFLQELIQNNQIYLITYNINQETLSQWIPTPSTVPISKPS